jgi:hypothetical protein
LSPPTRYLLAQDPLGQLGFGGSEVTLGGAEVTFGATETTFGDGEAEVDVGETGADPVLLAGRTEEVCFTGPPTRLDLLFGPPTEFCAKAGLANAQSARTDMTAPLFIDDSPSRKSKITPNRTKDKALSQGIRRGISYIFHIDLSWFAAGRNQAILERLTAG